jgi:two-component system, NarL family, invasion response regulator UvrY
LIRLVEVAVLAIRVLVADDHDLVRMGITRMLADVEGIDVVGEATTGEEALRLCRELTPQVVLMDIKMPGIGGLEATRKMTYQFPDVRVVVVTACDDDPFPTRLLKAGASGFVTKGTALSEMVLAIKSAAVGKRYICPQVAQQMALKSYDEEHKDNPFDALSERELQICMMVINCEKVQEISDKLHLSPKTVNSYRYRIFEKLGIGGDVELTRLAIRHGMLDAEAT